MKSLQIRGRLYNLFLKAYVYAHPYRFRKGKYKAEFINRDILESENKSTIAADRKIYVFWTGENEITPNRKEGLLSLEKCAGVPVILVTPRNLHEYILPEDPLPEAYQFLSLNHKSDLLRSYFMYHYGGGYADIKRYEQSWVASFDKLNNSIADILGYQEVGPWGIADIQEDARLRKDLEIYWQLLLGNGAFICRPHTEFTKIWYEEAKNRVIQYTEELKKHPAQDPFGKNPDYPLRWTFMQGDIFHPLCLRFHDRLLMDDNIKPSFTNYR